MSKISCIYAIVNLRNGKFHARATSKISCIYAIVNIRNGKRYIGGTAHFTRRTWIHRSQLRNGIHDNPSLQEDWNTYGEDAFIFGIIEAVPVEQLKEQEQAYLDAAQPRVYNYGIIAAAPMGGRRHDGWTRGRKHSEQTIHKMRHARANRISAWKSHTPESIEKIRAASMGRKHSEETLAKMRASMMGKNKRVHTHCLRGHKLSPNNVYSARGKRQCRTCALLGRALRKINSRPHAA